MQGAKKSQQKVVLGDIQDRKKCSFYLVLYYLQGTKFWPIVGVNSIHYLCDTRLPNPQVALDLKLIILNVLNQCLKISFV